MRIIISTFIDGNNSIITVKERGLVYCLAYFQYFFLLLFLKYKKRGAGWIFLFIYTNRPTLNMI